MFLHGNLGNTLIDKNHSNFSLDGMVNPSFQNEGTASVNINGRELKPGQSFSAFAPIVLRNSIPITFEADSTKTRILYLGYITLVEQP